MSLNLENYIASIPGFPKEGILFRDVTPILSNPEAYKETIRLFCDYAKKVGATKIAGPEARGFWFGCPVAAELSLGFVPVRKPGKLPRETVSEKYDLEYGSNEVCMHKDAIEAGDKVLIIDDLLATGGTAEASAKMVENNGGINGGITNGMPIRFQTVFKPTPSISQKQKTVNFKTNENVEIEIHGRHDPAIIHRARVVVDAMCAITLVDLLITRYGTMYFGEER